MTVFIAVNHGKCEEILCKYLSHVLRLDIILISRDGGEETISLKESGNFLREGHFRDMASLNRYYRRVKKIKGKANNLKLEDITIFVIMDVDGDGLSARSFKSKDMFRESYFYDCIVPILSDPDLDTVLRNAGLNISDRNKPESYRSILGNLQSIDDLLEIFSNSDISVLIRELMKHCPRFQN